MTRQAADYMHLDGKEYSLIDVEKGKQIIDCATFELPEGDPGYPSSDCSRGYAAIYWVIQGILYGVRMESVTRNGERMVIESPRTMIPFTGSCIVAHGGGHNSDFIISYLDYDEALELYFEQGVLKEKLTLMSAIEKARVFQGSDEYKNKIETAEADDSDGYTISRAIAYELRQSLDEIAREPLKHQYGWRTYKWRGIGDD